MGSGVNGARGTSVLTDRPELFEGGYALDGGHIGLLMLVDIVGAAIGLKRALLHHAGAISGIASAPVLTDVVLGERVGEPAVDGEEGGATGFVVGVVGDLAM